MTYQHYPTDTPRLPPEQSSTGITPTPTESISPEISEILNTVPLAPMPNVDGSAVKYLSWIACTAIATVGFVMIVQILKPNNPSADVLALQRDTLEMQREAIAQMERPDRCIGICIGDFGRNDNNRPQPRQREQEPRLATDSQQSEEPESNVDGWVWRVPGGEEFVTSYETSEFYHDANALINPLTGFQAGQWDEQQQQYLYTLITE